MALRTSEEVIDCWQKITEGKHNLDQHREEKKEIMSWTIESKSSAQLMENKRLKEMILQPATTRVSIESTTEWRFRDK